MEPNLFASATAMLRAVAAGIPYDDIATEHGVTKTTVSYRVRCLARALQQIVGVLEVDEDTSPTASLLRRHRYAYLEALEHFRPGAAGDRLEPPHTLTPSQLDLLLTKIERHSHTPQRDKALLLALFSTGAKPLEIAQLQVRDYLDADGKVRTRSVLRAEIATNQADRPLLFTCPETVAAIDAYVAGRSTRQPGMAADGRFRGLDPDSRLFLSRDGHPLRVCRPAHGYDYAVCKDIHEIYRRIFKYSGLGGLHSACARRMAAARMVAQGASEQDIGHALGVKSAAVRQLLKTAA